MVICEVAKILERERFKMGLGVREFSKVLGITWATYYSFKKPSDRRPQARTVYAITKFLKSRNIEIDNIEIE